MSESSDTCGKHLLTVGHLNGSLKSSQKALLGNMIAGTSAAAVTITAIIIRIVVVTFFSGFVTGQPRAQLRNRAMSAVMAGLKI